MVPIEKSTAFSSKLNKTLIFDFWAVKTRGSSLRRPDRRWNIHQEFNINPSTDNSSPLGGRKKTATHGLKSNSGATVRFREIYWMRWSSVMYFSCRPKASKASNTDACMCPFRFKRMGKSPKNTAKLKSNSHVVNPKEPAFKTIIIAAP